MAIYDYKINYHQMISWYLTKMSQSVQVHYLPISNRNVVKGFKHLIHHSYLNIQVNGYIKHHLQHDRSPGLLNKYEFQFLLLMV